MGVTAVVGYVFRWTAGNKLLEQPFPLKIVIVVVMLMFLYNIGMTIRASGRLTTTEGVLVAGLACSALLYLPALARVRQLHAEHLLPLVDGPSLGRGRVGDDPGRAPRLPADPALRAWTARSWRSGCTSSSASRSSPASSAPRTTTTGSGCPGTGCRSAASSARSSRCRSWPWRCTPTTRCAAPASATRTAWPCTGPSAARSSRRSARASSASPTPGRRSTSGPTAR